MKLLRKNLTRCRKHFIVGGKNTNYLGEFRYLRDVIHRINLRCLNASNDEIYELNIIAKETIEKAFSKYIHFDKWTIVDLPFVSNLQKWYLSHEIKNVSKLRFVSAYDYSSIIDKRFDLCIGTNSISELAWDDFETYF